MPAELERDLEALLARAYAEDLPDWSTQWCFSADDRARAVFRIKAAGVLAGLGAARRAFTFLDEEVQFDAGNAADGDRVAPGDVVARVEGSARTLLAAERTALNLLMQLSGIATLTRRFVDAVAGTRARILDTRKTTPGLRALEKAAVAAGGGTNHRMGLYDMVMLKDNHLDRAGGIGAAVARVRAAMAADAGAPLAIEVECRTLANVGEALALGVERIMLDNMDLETMRAAVALAAGRARLEASGGVTLASVRAIAETGVDDISVGALTHSAPALDVSMKIELA